LEFREILYVLTNPTKLDCRKIEPCDTYTNISDHNRINGPMLLSVRQLEHTIIVSCSVYMHMKRAVHLNYDNSSAINTSKLFWRLG